MTIVIVTERNANCIEGLEKALKQVVSDMGYSKNICATTVIEGNNRYVCIVVIPISNLDISESKAQTWLKILKDDFASKQILTRICKKYCVLISKPLRDMPKLEFYLSIVKKAVTENH